jgi:FAD/FMN-containing dehydrogenase
MVGALHARSATDLQHLDPGVEPRNLNGDLWLRPGTTSEVSTIVAYCHEHHIGVVPHGGRTGLSGGAISHSGEVIVSLERFTECSVDPVSRTAVVGAGVRLSTLAELAGEYGLSVGVDLGARDSATLGGMVSTNAGGISAFRHGTLRERVLGLEAVLPDGRVLSELGQVVKRNEGIGVERLLVGAEGTLGIITRISLALVPADGPVATALVALPDLTFAVRLVTAALATTHATPTALEFMSGNHSVAVCRDLNFSELLELAQAPFQILVEMAAATQASAEESLMSLLESSAGEGWILDASIAQNEEQRNRFWRVREDWAVDRERPGGLWYDISVPLSQLTHYVQDVATRLAAHDPSLSIYLLGHLADGNLHVTVNAEHPIAERYEEIAGIVTAGLTEVGGSYSAEHGIGHEKKATLERWIHPTKRQLMREIKALFDPRGIFNRGKVIPD